MLIDDMFQFSLCPLVGTEARFKAAWEEHTALLRKGVLSQCPVFEISNVARYLYHERVNADLKLADFPRPIPPFEIVWFEWRFPPMEKLRNGERPNYIREFLADRGGCLAARYGPEKFAQDAPAGTEFCVDLSLFMRPRGRNLIAAMHRFVHFFSSTGEALKLASENGEDTLVSVPRVHEDELDAWDDKADLVGPTIEISNVVLLAMSLLNCRNVVTREVKAEQHQIDAKRKHGRHCVRSHHVIEIQPIITAVHSATGRAGYTRNAAPIIRGHFKDFRERGLFGKHKGIYWWDQVVRSADRPEYRLSHAEGELSKGWKTKPD